MRFGARRPVSLAPLAALSAWAFLGGGPGCLPASSPPPGCLDYASREAASAAQRGYDYAVPFHTVVGFGVDWVGAVPDAVIAEGAGSGCLVGGRIEGTFDQNDTWDLYHDRFGLVIRAAASPFVVEDLHVMNVGDGISLKPSVPCPSSSSSPWLSVRRSLLEDIHDDAIESDGLCAARIEDNLIDRAYVPFAFRNRSSEPTRSGAGNVVQVWRNLIRLHSFASNYGGQTAHNGFWKWAHDARGPRISVRDNRFLAFDAPTGGSLFPYTNRVIHCSNNVLLFAGSEAEWQQALLGGCDDEGDDGLCDGQRMLALAGCFTVVTKPDTQSEADFLAAHWDPFVAAWKAAHSADDE
jgi:hypothetical protein